MKKTLLRILLCLGCAVLAGVGAGLYRMYYDRKCPNFSASLDLYVYPGMDPSSVIDTILSSGKVLSPRSLVRCLSPLPQMKAGHYTLDTRSSSMYVSRMLSHGWQTPVRLTLSGAIRSPKVLSRKIGAQMLLDSARVAAFVCSNDSLSAYGIDTTRLFCMIIPDTYSIMWTASVREVMDLFKKECDLWWTPERLAAARGQGLTPQEVSILASIVDGESRCQAEQPRIAGVYLNRLRTGMKLQADPTVAYCYGYRLNRILKKHLEVDSPYNTYRYAGLPPGPISCPPKNCLEAVLAAESHSYLFFCANPNFDGTHLFAKSYTDHLANARQFQAALTRRAKEKAAAPSQ